MSKRINITVSDVVYEELKTISENFGMPVSSIGSMAIMTYLQQQKMVASVDMMKSMFGELKDMDIKKTLQDADWVLAHNKNKLDK